MWAPQSRLWELADVCMGVAGVCQGRAGGAWGEEQVCAADPRVAELGDAGVEAVQWGGTGTLAFGNPSVLQGGCRLATAPLRSI